MAQQKLPRLVVYGKEESWPEHIEKAYIAPACLNRRHESPPRTWTKIRSAFYGAGLACLITIPLLPLIPVPNNEKTLRAPTNTKPLEHIPKRPETPMTLDQVLGQAFILAELQTGLSSNLLRNIAMRESSMNPEATNGDALGLMQDRFGPFFYEKIYKHAAAAGFAELAQLVERYNENEGIPNRAPVYNYRPVDDGAKQQLRAACFDPAISIALTAQKLSREAEKVCLALNKEKICGTYIHFTHFLGTSGAIRFLSAYEDPSKHRHRAADYASSGAVSRNRSVFYDGNRARSVAEVFEDVRKDIEYQAEPGIQPSDTLFAGENTLFPNPAS